MKNPEYKFDWFSHHIDLWKRLFRSISGRPNLKFLEIGSFEGRSARWLMENVLTHPTSFLVCVDPHHTGTEYDVFLEGARDRFLTNIEPFRERIVYLQSTSVDVGGSFNNSEFDFVYVDGSHTAENCLHDCKLALRCLKAGGMCIVDDYNNGFLGVKGAWSMFLDEHKDQVKYIIESEQVVFWKQ